MCGENALLRGQEADGRGSPPRVRGKRAKELNSRKPSRITPACAGKTLDALYLYGVNKDHPRVCGENLFLEVRIKSQAGSPPRVRGKLLCIRREDIAAGITPACAGKTGF